MLTTRSIGGKLACGFVALIALLIVLGITGGMSLNAHARMIGSLERSIKQAPIKGELISSFGLLIQPLTAKIPSDAEADKALQLLAAKNSQKEFAKRLDGALRRVKSFQQQLVDCGVLATGSSGQNRELISLFQNIDSQFNQLQLEAPHLGELENRDAHVQWMLIAVSDLIENTTLMPDPAAHLGTLLENARADQRFYFWLICVLGVASVLVVIALAAGGYFWFVKPLRILHSDFDRVAGGDYAHRARVDTKDEIHDLAASFNLMTSRFQDERQHQAEQIRMQASKMMQHERLADIGFFASGVAHEINNPLGVITMCAETLSRQFLTPIEKWKPADVEEGQQYSQMIVEYTKRCVDISDGIRAFAHGSSGEKNIYDVTAIVREVVTNSVRLGHCKDRSIVFEQHAPCEAFCCGGEVRQVVVNLVRNALQAMSPGGTLKIALSETVDQLDLTFTDDGIGMTPETLQKLFDPFFTTKEVGQGTGLGLSFAQKIVVSHGGSITATSDGPGKGSTFRIRLPRGVASTRAA